MKAADPTRHVAANAVAAAACALALWWAFYLGRAVPLLSYVDVTIHDLGHLLTAWSPGIVDALSGSVLQIAVPLLLALYFWFGRRETYSTAIALAWAGTSAQNVSTFIANAPRAGLPALASGIENWSSIFATQPEWAAPISGWVWGIALATVVLGLLMTLTPLIAQIFDWKSGAKARAADEARLMSLPRREPRNKPRGATPLGSSPTPAPPWDATKRR
jgi:hypothetical protein